MQSHTSESRSLVILVGRDDAEVGSANLWFDLGQFSLAPAGEHQYIRSKIQMRPTLQIGCVSVRDGLR